MPSAREAGGILCPRCSGRLGDTIDVDPTTFRVLRFLQSRDWAMVRRIKLKSTTRGRLERIMHAYMRHQIEGELHSVGFLERFAGRRR